MSYETNFSPRQQEAMRAVTCAAFDIVDATYGVGDPEFEAEAETPLAYHNGYHARAVSEGAVRVGEEAGLSPSELAIAEVAGASHDLVQLIGRGNDEAASAEWLTEQLREKGFQREVAEIGSLAIIGTEPLFENSVLVGQKATELDYPSRTAELIAKCVAAADLGSLWKPEGPYLGHQLYREIKKFKSTETPSVEDLVAFERGQQALYSAYSYPLPEGNILATHRSDVEAYSEQLLARIEAGYVHTWEQLIAQDMRFMNERLG